MRTLTLVKSITRGPDYAGALYVCRQKPTLPHPERKRSTKRPHSCALLFYAAMPGGAARQQAA
jgi:hypothetical protein